MSDYTYNSNALFSANRGSSKDVKLSVDDELFIGDELFISNKLFIDITVKYFHNSSTRNILGHLWTKHRIDKDYPKGIETSDMIIKATELQKAIDYLALILLLEYKHCDQLDSEYLNLTYSILNLIYPTMKLFIKKFMPSDEQTKKDYINLLFESKEQTNNQSQLIDKENSNKNSNESNIDESVTSTILKQL
ncbi:10074_t:CDS:2 [Scutellospora calospora]|uniref:10074_t:CDS:1 n=1 Tax=Scutellospora calospora TaxID=85575 RepID=A0ACA9LQZ2_9GLOM|nr:10074_t:CDS:2 [Scutellospora calospora]